MWSRSRLLTYVVPSYALEPTYSVHTRGSSAGPSTTVGDGTYSLAAAQLGGRAGDGRRDRQVDTILLNFFFILECLSYLAIHILPLPTSRMETNTPPRPVPTEGASLVLVTNQTSWVRRGPHIAHGHMSDETCYLPTRLAEP